MQIEGAMKSRAELRGYFVSHAVPTEQQFADLIASSINQRDDLLVRAAGLPLALAATGSGRALELYADAADPAAAWALTVRRVTSGGGPSLTIDDGNGNSRITVDAAGNVGIGRAPGQKLDVQGAYIRVSGAGNEQAYIGGDGSGADVQLGSFNPAVTNVAVWNAATNTRMVFFAQSVVPSDARLKRDIGPLTGALDRVLALAPVAFRDRHGGIDAPERLGLVAQEVAEVAPGIVATDGQGYRAIDYSGIVSLLVGAVKEQAARISALETALGAARA